MTNYICQMFGSLGTYEERAQMGHKKLFSQYIKVCGKILKYQKNKMLMLDFIILKSIYTLISMFHPVEVDVAF